MEREIVIGMISSTKFLHNIEPFFNPNILESKPAKLLAGWVWDYYEKYKKAPKQNLRGIFLVESKNLDETTIQDIELILNHLTDFSKEKNLNNQYLLDITKKYVREREIRNIANNILGLLDRGNETDLDKAESVLSKGLTTFESDTNIMSPLTDWDGLKDALNLNTQPIIEVPGYLGDLLNPALVPDSFVSFMGREKIGKTFFLFYLMNLALIQGKKVMFWNCGDLTYLQFQRRLAIFLSGKNDLEKYCGEYFVPVKDCVNNQNGKCLEGCKIGQGKLFDNEKQIVEKDEILQAIYENPEYKPCWVDTCKFRQPAVFYRKKPASKPLTPKIAKKYYTQYVKMFGNNLKTGSYRAEELTPDMVRRKKEILFKQNGWLADVDIFDYIDIMRHNKNISSNEEERGKINNKWINLRALSQEYHNLVITATQIKADYYNKPLLDMAAFQGDKRQLGHVTACFGLNRTSIETQLGTARINNIVIRDGEEQPFKPAKILQNLRVGRFVLDSF